MLSAISALSSSRALRAGTIPLAVRAPVWRFRSYLMSIRSIAVCLAVASAGCSSVSYRPVQETEFDRLVNEGCSRKDERFAVTAQINSASRETVVLWDGYDGSRTVAIRLPKQGMGSRMRDVVGKSRYELGFERLNQLRVSASPVLFSMNCERKDLAPVANRFSYLENGERVQFEF